MNVMPLPLVRFSDLNRVSESRPAALIAPRGDWAKVQRTLELPLLVQAEPSEATLRFFDYLAEQLPSAVEVIYMVGAHHLSLDAAKYIAYKRQKSLVVVPSNLFSTDLLSAYINVEGQRQLVGAASEVVIDMALIGAEGNAAGILADAMASITALMDWSYATQLNKTTAHTKFNAWAASLVANFAQQSLKLAGGVGKKDTEAIRALLDLVCLATQLDNQLGHELASHGTEHLVAASAAERSEFAALDYGDRVALGIVLTAALHKKDTAPLRAALEGAGFKLGSISKDALHGLLDALQPFAMRYTTAHTIAHDVRPQSDEIEQAITKSGLG